MWNRFKDIVYKSKLDPFLPRANLTRNRRLRNPGLSNGVTTQLKGLDEYVPMVPFVLVLRRIHFLAVFLFNLDREAVVKGLISSC